MKLYIIAGESSGDFIGGLLIKALKDHGDIALYGIGGNHMQDEGLTSLVPISDINLMGFFEVLPHICRIRKLINKTVEDILAQNPDALVTIDSPAFTYRVADKVRQKAPHIKLVHIVAPSVWAYKPSRAKKYAKLYDHLLTLLPFEPSYFTIHGLPSTCIGHPILEQAFYVNSKSLIPSPNLNQPNEFKGELARRIEISEHKRDSQNSLGSFKEGLTIRKEMGISKGVKVIAVTPGSRLGEISRHMPIIRQVFDELSSAFPIKVIFVQPDESNMQNILKYLGGAKFDFIFSTERLKSFAVSDCVLAKSGTNTLEIAASRTPMIVCYKLNPITFFFLKLIIKVKYACLINIISDSEIVPEYIQSDFNAKNIVSAISKLLNDNESSLNQVLQSQKILESIGLNSDHSPSKIAAKIIIDICRNISYNSGYN